jgi:undecaprenyl phosphate N,N'-diacetylbacillosamine 1-phosphate transferase
MYRRFGKRMFDFLTSIFLLFLLSPILIALTVLLSIANKGSAFFIHSRPGFREKSFNLIKFKTMSDARDENGSLLPDKYRITKVGSVVRKTSFDELPQLINVVLGHMSLVGPRPLLFKYIPLYNEIQKKRHNVRPGITGWAQVNGRNSISWQKKFELDIYYEEHLSFMLDLKIGWLTILKVVKREGVNQSEERPMEPFTGNN